MSWSSFMRCLRRVEGLLADLGSVFQVPLGSIGREWRQRRAVRRDVDRRLAAWHALPPDEQRKWVHPASPNKPSNWSVDEYKENQRRQRGPAN